MLGRAEALTSAALASAKRTLLADWRSILLFSSPICTACSTVSDCCACAAAAIIAAHASGRTREIIVGRYLTNAEIDLLKEKKNFLSRGEALITVKGDGLQPHLEAFMWEILKSIQVRATQEGAEFLIGST